METSVRLFHPTRVSDRLAVVAVRPASEVGKFLVQVALGTSRLALTNTRLFGPYDVAAATAAFESALAKLREAGYGTGGTAALVEALRGKSAKRRARAAETAGWRRDRGTIGALLERAATPREEIASVLFALARMGEAGAIAAARSEAGKKLLWRRRAGVEALRALGDAAGLAEADARARERLAPGVRAALDGGDATALAAAALADPKEAGAALDTLYELATPTAIAAVRRALGEVDLARPGVWRYVKSVLKRALLRLDGPTLGPLLHRIEMTSRTTPGATASLKSGLDGETREVRVFGRKTVDYLRRLVWRVATRVARYDGLAYAGLAAWLVVPYRAVDDLVPTARLPRTATCHALHRVLFGASPRFVWQWRKMRFVWKGVGKGLAEPPPGAREEAFAALWDAAPAAYVTLLAHARHPLALAFAKRAVEARHPRLLEGASAAELQAIFAQEDDAVAALALPELRRRFDANRPDLALVAALLAAESERAQALGVAYLTDCAHVWTRDAERCFAFLSIVTPVARETAARLFVASARSLPPGVRAALAARIAARVAEPEPADGAFLALGEAAQALAPEIAACVSPEGALALLDVGSDAAAIVARLALAGAPDVAALPRARLIALATSERALVRMAALVVLERAAPDLALVVTLGESAWPDVRQAGARLLAALDAAAFTLAEWLALLDATHPEPQAAARALLQRHLAAVDVPTILARLAQHPDRAMRTFVVELALAHLPPGADALTRLVPVLRATLFDVRPVRALRTRVLELIVARGLASEDEALVAAAVLGDVVRSATHDVRERALRGLVELSLAWPIVAVGTAPLVKVVTPARGSTP